MIYQSFAAFSSAFRRFPALSGALAISFHCGNKYLGGLRSSPPFLVGLRWDKCGDVRFLWISLSAFVLFCFVLFNDVIVVAVEAWTTGWVSLQLSRLLMYRAEFWSVPRAIVFFSQIFLRGHRQSAPGTVAAKVLWNTQPKDNAA